MLTEAGIHHTLRVALTREGRLADDVNPWRSLRFRHPCSCTSRNLLRLARAAHPERLLITIAGSEQDFFITGLARDGFGEGHETLKIQAPAPGCLELWVGGQRLLEYANGYIQTPPEDLLLATGRVRQRLLDFATEAAAPPGFIQTVSSLVHRLADHPHGGILVLSAEREPYIPAENSFALEAETHLWDILRDLGTTPGRPGSAKERASEHLHKEALRAEIGRVVAEIGRMTALDGATILDRQLAVRGFGVVLPVRPDVEVIEVLDPAGLKRRAFPLGQYGARHRAAASYAASHAGSLVLFGLRFRRHRLLASRAGHQSCAVVALSRRRSFSHWTVT